MQAIFGIETAIDPANIEAAIFDVGNYSGAGTERLPIRLRLHASTSMFIQRYYRDLGRLRVPSEKDLTTAIPIIFAEDFELKQLETLNTILANSATELEKPMNM